MLILGLWGQWATIVGLEPTFLSSQERALLLRTTSRLIARLEQKYEEIDG